MEPASKAGLRAKLLAARGGVADDVRVAEAEMLGRHLEHVVNGDSTVCAYVPVGTEPGSIDMLNVLLAQARRVLLPVARTTDDDVPLPLRWGEYRSHALVPGRWGLLEPAMPHLPESAIAEASLVLVPALAVDRRGARLGRGAGFYDRSLAGRDPQARVVAIVRDQELIDELPSEPHDVAMSHALTPRRGLIALPNRE
ncbi:5-formyltetrahydrofolate cyclo-ligase [Mycobacterium spongiae]|uniref:5-formyltetrahydrofolate cyclo-ligase n=1 Tax=Mycobacterium spongiae TaxID=886343 RepID=A0A975JZR3_9MYCO|nr:5-formyltetrahydrofolate cyclo-ligase [Mycobacterium spongiae]QUR68717.1 5-formyltetrahydrofolate cyclo-ligase [Mycobacterium spongiae]